MKAIAARMLAALFLTAWGVPAHAVADPTPQVDSTGTVPCCPSPRFLGPRSKDGNGVDATFDTPASITYDPDDDAFFIADTGSNAIRRFDADGRVSTVAGACDRELLTATCVGRELDGIGPIARFDRPVSIAYDHKQRGLVVYDGASSMLRFVTTSGRVSTRGFVSDVQAIAIDSRTGDLYAARLNTVARLEDFGGGERAFAVWTSPNNLERNIEAPVGQVNSIAVDPKSGDIYAMLYGKAVMRIDLAHAGAAIALAGDPDSNESLFAGLGKDGQGANASFQAADYITFDSVGRRVLVADMRAIRSVSMDGAVRTIAGGCEPQSNPRYRGEFACDYPAHDGFGAHAHFGYPIRGIAFDTRHDAIAVLDQAFVKLITADGRVTLAAGNVRPLPAQTLGRWNSGYTDTETGETMSVYVDGDNEIEVFQDPRGRIFDVKRGLRSVAFDNAQFWTAPTYVRIGAAIASDSYATALGALACGTLSELGSKNPISKVEPPGSREALFATWYDSFSRGQTPDYSRSRSCVALRVTDGAGRVAYEDTESRLVPHAMPDGLLEYPDERRYADPDFGPR
jgi:hypothetical protein